ncbi:hypothetical protein JXA47_07790 [Candidatus Sumerlaeota bacterium]|nr:hypothetical protein [Candidatus Sumerlaeota bacterium]
MADTPPPVTESEPTLHDLVRRLWRRRVSLILWPLVVGFLAGLGTLFLPDLYQPQAIVSIQQPSRREGLPLVPLDTLVQNYRYLLRSPNLQRRALDLLAATDGSPFTAEEFGARVSVSVPRESQLLFIGFQDEDCALASRAANALAESLLHAVSTFNQTEVDRFRGRYLADIASAEALVETTRDRLAEFQRMTQLDLLAEEIEGAALRRTALEEEWRAVELQLAVMGASPVEERLGEAEEDLRLLQTQTQIENLTSLRLALLEQQTDFENRLATARVDLAAARQRHAALEEDLAGQSAVIPLRRAIDDEAALQQAAAATSGVELSDLLGLTVTTEELNPIHSRVATDVIAERARVAELEQTERELSERLASLETEITSIDTAIYRGELALSRATRDVELADAEYRTLFETSPESLRTQAEQLSAERSSLHSSLEEMRARHHRQTAEMRLLEQEWEMAHARLERFTQEHATATLTILEQMPTLSLLSPAPDVGEPLPKRRPHIALAGMILGFALALVRAQWLEL